MEHKTRHRWLGTWEALPKIFDLQPTENYRALFSTSAEALSTKAWSVTAERLNNALSKVVRSKPELKVVDHYLLSSALNLRITDAQEMLSKHEEMISSLQARERELQCQLELLNIKLRELNGDGDEGEPADRSSKSARTDQRIEAR